MVGLLLFSEEGRYIIEDVESVHGAKAFQGLGPVLDGNLVLFVVGHHCFQQDQPAIGFQSFRCDFVVVTECLHEFLPRHRFLFCMHTSELNQERGGGGGERRSVLTFPKKLVPQMEAPALSWIMPSTIEYSNMSPSRTSSKLVGLSKSQ